MLKIFKYNNYNKKYKDNYVNNINHHSFIKEWYNNIYTYNKSTVKLLSSANKYTLKLIKGYFNLYSLKLEKKIRLSRLPNWMRKLSVKRILIDIIELKHTSNKVIITICIYNRFNIYILNKINKLKRKKLSISKIKFMKNKIYNISIDNSNIFKFYKSIYIKSIIKKLLFKIKLYVYYRQILLLNEFKFKDIYIIPLKILLEKIYNKKVEFNLISLKYYYLDSNIHLQVLATKLRNRKNRIYRVLRKSFLKIKLPYLQELILYTDNNKRKNKEGFNNNNINDILENILYNHYNLYKNRENIILSSIKNRIPGGIRIEAKGRLSKRLIASRTIFKYKYTGNLRNLYSSYLGMSSPILRGTLRSNLDYTKFKSKTKIGSFGLKSWINNI